MLKSGALVVLLFILSPLPVEDFGPLQLNWETHYKAKPDSGSKFLALTALIFKYSYRSSLRGNNLTLNFSFGADVDKNKSWVKLYKLPTEQSSRALLKHEQGHVDINYMLMRETERRLKAKKYNIRNFKTEISTIAGQAGEFYNDMQTKYDQETNHGTIRRVQLRWDDFIARSLKDLADKP